MTAKEYLEKQNWSRRIPQDQMSVPDSSYPMAGNEWQRSNQSTPVSHPPPVSIQDYLRQNPPPTVSAPIDEQDYVNKFPPINIARPDILKNYTAPKGYVNDQEKLNQTSDQIKNYIPPKGYVNDQERHNQTADQIKNYIPPKGYVNDQERAKQLADQIKAAKSNIDIMDLPRIPDNVLIPKR
jgi:hypothetical protein